MTRHEVVQLALADGVSETHIHRPDGDGQWPAVVMYMDAAGVRPALQEIAERVASDGYVVVLPNLFYRSADFDATEGIRLFTDAEYRRELFTRVTPLANSANVMRDTDAILAYLDGLPHVRHGRFGVIGYCMGGRLALYAAGHYGERVAAAASYHAGGVATDAPDSPHRLAGRMRGRVYVAGAIEDRSFDDEQKGRLEEALTAAGVEHMIETYDAKHGFVPRDTPVHDEAAAARHWATLLPLLRTALHGDGR